MNSQDVFYYALAIGLLVLVGFISYLAYEVVLTLRSFRDTLKHIEAITSNVQDLTMDVSSLKNKFKIGSLTIIGSILKFMLGKKWKGGE